VRIRCSFGFGQERGRRPRYRRTSGACALVSVAQNRRKVMRGASITSARRASRWAGSCMAASGRRGLPRRPPSGAIRPH